MQIMKLSWLIAVCLIINSCAGTPPTRFYILESTAPNISEPAPENRKVTAVGIGPLTLPAVLNRKQIVTRGHDHTVLIAELDQWAAPLKDTIAEVIRQDLSKLSPDMTFRAYPWSAFGGVDYRLVVDISRFDSEPGVVANLTADWAIINETGHNVIKKGRFEQQTANLGLSYAANVQAMNQLLGEFSAHLAKVLAEAF